MMVGSVVFVMAPLMVPAAVVLVGAAVEVIAVEVGVIGIHDVVDDCLCVIVIGSLE